VTAIQQQRPRRRARLTQIERLLRHARDGHPLDQNDWWNETPDGGPPIKALRTRVSNLEARGYVFSHVVRRGRLAEYRLLAKPGDVQPEAEQVDDDAEQIALAEGASAGAAMPSALAHEPVPTPPNHVAPVPIPHWRDWEL
jgi:hypothetical protein